VKATKINIKTRGRFLIYPR